MTAANGYRWAAGVTDNVGRLVFVAAIFGAPALVVAWQRYPWPWVAVGVVAVLVVTLAEGAYRTYADEVNRPRPSGAAPALNPNHLRDLQEFARREQELLNDRVHREIELGTALGRSLSVHYSEVGALAAAWNNLDVNEPRQKAYERVVNEATRLGLRETPAISLFSALTTYLDASELSWRTEGKEIIASRGDDENFQWTFQAPDAEWAGKIRAELIEAAAGLRELPEIRASLEVQARHKQLRSELLARLDFVERNHNLDYRPDCELCRGLTALPSAGLSISNTSGSQ